MILGPASDIYVADAALHLRYLETVTNCLCRQIRCMVPALSTLHRCWANLEKAVFTGSLNECQTPPVQPSTGIDFLCERAKSLALP